MRFSLKRGFWIWKSCLKIRSQSFFMRAQTYRHHMLFSEKWASLKIIWTLPISTTSLKTRIRLKTVKYGSHIYIYWVSRLVFSSLLASFCRKKSQSFTIFLRFQREHDIKSTSPIKKSWCKSRTPKKTLWNYSPSPI